MRFSTGSLDFNKTTVCLVQPVFKCIVDLATIGATRHHIIHVKAYRLLFPVGCVPVGNTGIIGLKFKKFQLGWYGIYSTIAGM